MNAAWLILAAPIIAWLLDELCTRVSRRTPSPSVQAHERLRREEEWCGISPQPGALDRHIAAYRGDER